MAEHSLSVSQQHKARMFACACAFSINIITWAVSVYQSARCTVRDQRAANSAGINVQLIQNLSVVVDNISCTLHCTASVCAHVAAGRTACGTHHRMHKCVCVCVSRRECARARERDPLREYLTHARMTSRRLFLVAAAAGSRVSCNNIIIGFHGGTLSPIVVEAARASASP